MTETPALAVDILLQPGPEMVARAESANADLLRVFPGGFPLDEQHRPHITMVQAYVDAARLDELTAALGEFLAEHPVDSWTLRGTSFYYLPFNGLGAAGIVVERTPELVSLQSALVELIRPFLVEGGDGDAFVRTTAEPEINQPTQDYVGAFVRDAVGDNFNPHVTTGVATQEHLDALLAEPFSDFTFSPRGAAIYQLGNLGTAARLLHDWSPTVPA